MYKKLEPFIAYLLGAPVKDKQGRIWKRPSFRKVIQKALDPELWGIDISKWQGVIDWVKVKLAGIRFLILRCSYGIWPDEKFTEYMGQVINVFIGWLFGVYHYYDPRYSPRAQADVLLKTIAPYRKYINRIWIDLEFTWSGNFEASGYWREFAQILLDNGYKIGFYTRKTWWDLYVGDLAWWFGKYPLWAAQYSSALTYIPKGWTEAQLWQDKTPLTADYFPEGTMPQSKEFDHDIAERSFFDTEFGTGTPPPTTGDEMFYLQVYTSDLSYRDRMDYETSQVLGYLKPGDIVEGVLHTNVNDVITQWIEFTKIYKASDNYSAVVVHAYCSGYTKYMQETTDPNPPPATPSIFITHEFNDVITLEDGSQYEANFTVENVEYTPKA